MAKIVLLASLLPLTHASSPSAPSADGTLRQLSSFPRSSITIEGAGRQHRLEVWLADTPARRAQGLMFVQGLPKGTGMLFLFGEPQRVSMWMKNTFISLDMLFIAANGRVMRITEHTQPHSLRSIDSGGLASAVLEIAAGESARMGIRQGDRVRHKAFTAE